MKRLAVVALLVVSCGALGVHAQTLSLAYKKGDVYKYGLHLTSNATIGTGAMTVPIVFDATGSETVTVVSVDASGTADVSIALSNLSLKTSLNGVTNTTTGMPATSVEMTIGPDGRVLTVNGEALGGTGLGQLSGNTGGFISAVLPNDAVKPGDTWSKSYDIANPAGTGTVHVKADSKYLRDESLKSVNAAVVETKSTATFNLTIDLSKMFSGSLGPSMPGMPTGEMPSSPQMPQTITVSGTSTSDTTSWIDPSGHRVMKTHETGSTNASLSIQLPTGAASSGTAATPMLTGPISVSAKQTMDLNPA